jgi:Protein of unknown function DUF2617
VEEAADMGVSFGRSRVADLAFQVFARSVHPDWFSVRAHHRVARQGWEADLRIIEGGHAVVFRCGHIRLTEVLAGPETLLPEPGLLFHASLSRARSTRLCPGLGLEYHVCLEVERVELEVLSHLSDEMTLDSSEGRLFHRFTPVSRLASAPVTHVRFEAMPRRLVVHAFHSFPEERAVVRIQSLYERP